MILISTHSCIDKELVEETKLPVIPVKPVPVTVADGRQLEVKAKCGDCAWTMNGTRFQCNLRVLELGDYDLILGTDWMRAHSPVTFDYGRNRLLIYQEGKMVELQGITSEVTLKLMSLKSLNKLVTKGWKGVRSSLFVMSVEKNEEEPITQPGPKNSWIPVSFNQKV